MKAWVRTGICLSVLTVGFGFLYYRVERSHQQMVFAIDDIKRQLDTVKQQTNTVAPHLLSEVELSDEVLAYLHQSLATLAVKQGQYDLAKQLVGDSPQLERRVQQQQVVGEMIGRALSLELGRPQESGSVFKRLISIEPVDEISDLNVWEIRQLLLIAHLSSSLDFVGWQDIAAQIGAYVDTFDNMDPKLAAVLSEISHYEIYDDS